MNMSLPGVSPGLNAMSLINGVKIVLVFLSLVPWLLLSLSRSKPIAHVH